MKSKKGRYFEGLIEKYLLNNQHKVRLIMSSDENYTKNEILEEKKLLSQIFSKMNEDDKKIIMEEVDLIF